MLDCLDPDQSCVLDLPLVLPDDWKTWWELWNKRRDVGLLYKGSETVKYGGRSYWAGLDIYRSDTYKPFEWKYLGHYIDATKLFPKMFEIINMIPAKIDVIRAVSSYAKFAPHSDWAKPAISLRSMLWDENPETTFYYQHGAEKIYQTLPSESNTWAYRDHGFKHGSDFDPQYQKILLMYQGTWDWDKLAPLVQRSKKRFPEHVK